MAFFTFLRSLFRLASLVALRKLLEGKDAAVRAASRTKAP